MNQAPSFRCYHKPCMHTPPAPELLLPGTATRVALPAGPPSPPWPLPSCCPGLLVFCCMPTTLSSGVALTQVRYGACTPLCTVTSVQDHHPWNDPSAISLLTQLHWALPIVKTRTRSTTLCCCLSYTSTGKLDQNRVAP